MASNVYQYYQRAPQEFACNGGAFALDTAQTFAPFAQAAYSLTPWGAQATGQALGQAWGQDIHRGDWGALGGDALALAGTLGAGKVFGVLGEAGLSGGADTIEASDSTVSVYHGSINDATSIRASGFDPSRGAPYVSTDINAARDAIGTTRYEVAQGLARDPGIIESRIPQSDFRRILAPLQRSYGGFYPYGLQSTEIVLRTPESIDLFNRYIVR